MRAPFYLSVLTLYQVIQVSSTPAAPLLGPGYPPPLYLTGNESLIPAIWANLSATLDVYISSNETIEGLVPDLGSYTFSIGAFSTSDTKAAEKLQYHHTAKDVQTSNLGVTHVDGDSIYRVASITKLFTVYLTLIEIGSCYWDRPITDFIPELAKFADQTPLDPINVVDWKSVTLGALAGQIAGIPRDTALLGADLLLAFQRTGSDISTTGLPPLNLSDPDIVDPCVSYSTVTGVSCPRDPYFQAWTSRAPIYSPWTSPIYTNGGFALLALALENISERSLTAMFQEDMFDRLNMKSTLLEKRDFINAVVPGGNASEAATNYLANNNNTMASGGIYSNLNDLAKFGTSILNSTLLQPQETRKWMKPISHTASLNFSVGRPWEIFRTTNPVNGRVSDLYTKAGDGPNFSSYIILSPDHEVGFTILVTGKTPTTIARSVLADIVTTTMMPALEAQAEAEAISNLAGTYTSNTAGLNSSITLSVDSFKGPGLLVTSWISNGTDMFTWLAPDIADEISLFQTGLRSAPLGQAGQVAFRGTYGQSRYTSDVGVFAYGVTTYGVWELVDTNIYGGASLDLFVFDVDASGEAVAVTPAATRGKLYKTS